MKRTFLIALAGAFLAAGATAAAAAPDSGSGHARGTLFSHQARLGFRGTDSGPHCGELTHSQWRHVFRFRHLAGESKGEGVRSGWSTEAEPGRLFIDEDGDGICDHAPTK